MVEYVFVKWFIIVGVSQINFSWDFYVRVEGEIVDVPGGFFDEAKEN